MSCKGVARLNELSRERRAVGVAAPPSLETGQPTGSDLRAVDRRESLLLALVPVTDRAIELEPQRARLRARSALSPCRGQ